MSTQQTRRWKRLTYANVISTLALIIAVSGGTAFAASKLITGNEIAKNTITGANIKTHSLVASNFAPAQLPQGPVGSPGAPGSAIAYGDLGLNANGNPVFNPTLTKGFTTASSPSPGIFCIPYPPGVTTNLPLAISDNGNEKAQWNQVANGQCDGSGFEIANTSGAVGLSGGGLNISVP